MKDSWKTSRGLLRREPLALVPSQPVRYGRAAGGGIAAPWAAQDEALPLWAYIAAVGESLASSFPDAGDGRSPASFRRDDSTVPDEHFLAATYGSFSDSSVFHPRSGLRAECPDGHFLAATSSGFGDRGFRTSSSSKAEVVDATVAMPHHLLLDAIKASELSTSSTFAVSPRGRRAEDEPHGAADPDLAASLPASMMRRLPRLVPRLAGMPDSHGLAGGAQTERVRRSPRRKDQPRSARGSMESPVANRSPLPPAPPAMAQALVQAPELRAKAHRPPVAAALPSPEASSVHRRTQPASCRTQHHQDIAEEGADEGMAASRTSGSHSHRRQSHIAEHMREVLHLPPAHDLEQTTSGSQDRESDFSEMVARMKESVRLAVLRGGLVDVEAVQGGQANAGEHSDDDDHSHWRKGTRRAVTFEAGPLEAEALRPKAETFGLGRKPCWRQPQEASLDESSSPLPRVRATPRPWRGSVVEEDLRHRHTRPAGAMRKDAAVHLHRSVEGIRGGLKALGQQRGELRELRQSMTKALSSQVNSAGAALPS
mmetsp:Transcript_47653/g.101983  ORF Transcript_47653/g.101983 Transcript_47653/m.101983 type:complete len:541 (-) Transcript_47653:60-1682(-)